MGNEKDPGKFTIRFNIADPQQQAVAELLNRQGRYKAQFITNAVVMYVHAASVPLSGSTAVQQIIEDHQESTSPKGPEITAAEENRRDVDRDNGIVGTDMDAIRRTMNAFHSM